MLRESLSHRRNEDGDDVFDEGVYGEAWDVRP